MIKGILRTVIVVVFSVLRTPLFSGHWVVLTTRYCCWVDAEIQSIDGHPPTCWSVVLFYYHRSRLVARESQNTRWVIVSRSNSSAARMGRPPLGQLRIERMTTSGEGGTDNGQDRSCAAISVSDPASPLTPRRDLLPVSLLSPSTSSVRQLLAVYLPRNMLGHVW